ncbi:MAG: imidazoleglycerol-phosphate dehydratase [Desulfovibrionales bacterium]
MAERTGRVERTTRETQVQVELNLGGSGIVDVQTGFGLADHMITLIGFWAGFDLTVSCRGDMEIDAHHSLEDVGLCLGEALDTALGDRKGIARIGWAKVPMDEALTEVVLDLSGRPYFVYQESVLPPVIAGEEKDIWREFFKSFAFKGRLNLHMNFCYGLNGHHLLESASKGLGLALAQGSGLSGTGVLSTKGSLD